MKYSSLVIIESIEKVSPHTYIFGFSDESIASLSYPGMFLSVEVDNHTFRRPFAFLDVDKSSGLIRFMFEVIGGGTKWIASLKEGDFINVLAPLGNSFPIVKKDETPLLISGSAGIAPLNFFAKEIHKDYDLNILMGFSTKENICLYDDLKKIANVHVSTDDGSFGFGGNVVMLLEDFLEKSGIENYVVYACGPSAMLKGLQEFMLKNSMRGYFSFECIMACSVGLCQGCALPINEESNNYALCCKDGSIFSYDYIKL